MPRKGHISKREPLPDPVYSSTLANKFVNSMMWDGKKSTAQGIFYESMEKSGVDTQTIDLVFQQMKADMVGWEKKMSMDPS